MDVKVNEGVRCNVCDCVYNEKGCNCNKKTIEVSRGQDLPKDEKPLECPHFCKSYMCKK